MAIRYLLLEVDKCSKYDINLKNTGVMHSSEQEQSVQLLHLAPFPAVGRLFANIVGRVGSRVNQLSVLCGSAQKDYCLPFNPACL